MKWQNYLMFLFGLGLFVEALIHIGDSDEIVSNIGSIVILIIGGVVSYLALQPNKK